MGALTLDFDTGVHSQSWRREHARYWYARQ
jgi:hypothetical protein